LCPHEPVRFQNAQERIPLHSPALDGALFIGKYRTVLRFRMFVAGPWFAPMMLPEPGSGHHVIGEFYRIEEGHSERIDALESIAYPAICG
jgi:gamma-glutamylcyclotransferase (GGCT)/AIG2-like uncharacterized protein YtfP